MPTTLIRNGTVVTAEGSVAADILVDGEKIRDIAPSLPPETAGSVIDATGMLVIPGGIDVHTHLDMPFGGTTSSRRFRDGHARGGFRRHDHDHRFRHPGKGRRMREALDTWWKKAEGSAAIDYGLHMIVTDLPDERSRRMKAMVGRGRDQLQTVHGLSGRLPGGRRDDLQAMSAHGENGGLICMHAENGVVIDVIVRRALAGGQDRAEISRADASDEGGSGGRTPRHRNGGDGGLPVYIVHLSSRGCAETGPGGARSRLARVRRDLPAIPAPLDDELRGLISKARST